MVGEKKGGELGSCLRNQVGSEGSLNGLDEDGLKWIARKMETFIHVHETNMILDFWTFSSSFLYFLFFFSVIPASGIPLPPATVPKSAPSFTPSRVPLSVTLSLHSVL